MKEKKRKPLAKRLMALLLIGAMLAPAATPAHAASEDTTADAPKIRVVATLVDGGQYLEVGLNIESKGDGAEGKENGFQSAGVLLKYAPAVLTPVTWGETAAAVNVPMLGAGEPVIIPSKGADELSGKLAEAIQVDEQGYLFLSAESARSTTLNQALPEEAAKEEPAPSSTEQTPGGYPIVRIKQAETAAAQAVAVRFRVNDKTPAGEGTEAEKYSLSELAAALDLVGTTETDKKALALFPLVDESGITYLADNCTVTTGGKVAEAKLSFVWIENGVTMNAGTGGGSANDFVTIVFYDWDETLLGSIVVPKGEDATALVNEFVKSQMSPDSRDHSIISGAEDTAKPYFVDDAKYPMTYKKGYSFLTWIPYDSELLTHCGRALDYLNKQTTIDEPTAAQKQDFSNIQGATAVKACYKDNAEMLYSTVAKDMFYSTNVFEYNRVGNSINYSIEVEVNRELDGKGVPRMGQPMLKVTSTTNAGALISFYEISNTDKTTFTFYPSTAVTKVAVTVVDFYGATNKAQASNKVGVLNENQGTGAAMDGFLWKGTISMINDAVAYENLNLLSVVVLEQQANLAVREWGFTAAQAQQSLRTAWLKQNSTDGTEATIKPENEWLYLTYAQMEHAIKNGGDLLSP